MKRSTVLLVGSGDIARRALPLLRQRYRVLALLRDPSRAEIWRRAGAVPVVADLDRRASLARLAGLADCILHFAPPPASGVRDARTANLLSALAKAQILPRRVVYISSSGVYGDHGGDWVDETTPANPRTDRARRRLDAERRLREWGARNGIAVSILRAPGIYAAERLPRERLLRGDPVFARGEDVSSNHIHADDLARLAVGALRRGRPGRVYNAADDAPLPVGDYFDAAAAALGLPPPPRLPRQEALARLAPTARSFLEESRRLDNTRIRKELRARLAHPRATDLLEDMARKLPTKRE